MALFYDCLFEAAREHFERAIELFGAGPVRNFGEAYYAQLAARARGLLGSARNSQHQETQRGCTTSLASASIAGAPT